MKLYSPLVSVSLSQAQPLVYHAPLGHTANKMYLPLALVSVSLSQAQPLVHGGNVSENGDQSECAVCLGKYEDDITDGILRNEWVRCTNIPSCGLWMHCDCLDSSEDNCFVCYICNVTFN